MTYTIQRDDILKRVCFIIKLTQSQSGSTMQGALTSKSDSMGGIFDRFINSLTEDILFDKILIPELNTNRDVKVVKDYYLYKPNKYGAGIAPDVFGLIVDNKTIPFVKFNNKWNAVEGMPQIEVKTFKEKDQMVSLRNQDYDSEYLVLADLDLRIDYLVPFLDKSLLNSTVTNSMKMDDSAFIENDTKNQIKKISDIDYSSDQIGSIKLISITNGGEFLRQSTLCKANIGPRRMKEIKERQVRTSNSLALNLKDFANVSPRISELYEFNNDWYDRTNIDKSKNLYLDFSAINIENIEIVNFNQSSVIIKAKADGCSFNEYPLLVDHQYTVYFDTLDRSGNAGEEHFMQKQCAKYLTSHKESLLEKFKEIIDNN